MILAPPHPAGSGSSPSYGPGRIALVVRTLDCRGGITAAAALSRVTSPLTKLPPQAVVSGSPSSERQPAAASHAIRRASGLRRPSRQPPESPLRGTKRVGSLGLSGEPRADAPGSPSRFRRDAGASRRNRWPRLPQELSSRSGPAPFRHRFLSGDRTGLPRSSARNRRLHCARPSLRGTGEPKDGNGGLALPGESALALRLSGLSRRGWRPGRLAGQRSPNCSPRAHPSLRCAPLGRHCGERVFPGEQKTGTAVSAFPESPGLTSLASPVRFRRDAYASRRNRRPSSAEGLESSPMG